MRPAQLRVLMTWSCPHHRCSVCDRNAGACGGVMFRCESCSDAFCEDHLPADVVAHGRVVDRCKRFELLGNDTPSTAVYIHCGPECEQFASACPRVVVAVGVASHRVPWHSRVGRCLGNGSLCPLCHSRPLPPPPRPVPSRKAAQE